MNELENLEEKTVSITFKVTQSMDKEIMSLMKKNRWKKSAFIRVSIQKELDRLKGK
jgi:hypothetical protein